VTIATYSKSWSEQIHSSPPVKRSSGTYYCPAFGQGCTLGDETPILSVSFGLDSFNVTRQAQGVASSNDRQTG
jgi:hypothetical protein